MPRPHRGTISPPDVIRQLIRDTCPPVDVRQIQKTDGRMTGNARICRSAQICTKMDLMLGFEHFEQLRREICASGPASDGDNLLGMEIDFCAFLGDPEYADEAPSLWQDMVVQRHEGAQWLITCRAIGRRQDADAIGAELARVWEECLSYRDRAGHTIETVPDRVVLRAVTQIAPGSLWVTATVQVDLA
jgi:hypothetical protein